MTAYQTIIRTGIYTAIENARGNTEYVRNDFVTAQTYYPESNLEDIGSVPEVKLSCLGMGADRQRTLRNLSVPLDLGVMVHVQMRVDPEATSTIDALVELVEQIMATCEDDELVSGADFNWASTEPLKDENGLIYSYEALTKAGVFQAVFIAHYTYIKQV